MKLPPRPGVELGSADQKSHNAALFIMSKAVVQWYSAGMQSESPGFKSRPRQESEETRKMVEL